MSQRILVVDDQKMMQDVVARALRRAGYFVVTASNGQEALEKFHSFSPDLVITDVVMPEKDGIELTKAIRSLNPDVKILAMSGYDGTNVTDFLSIVRHLGADDVLGKPFDFNRLRAKVSFFIGEAARKRA